MNNPIKLQPAVPEMPTAENMIEAENHTLFWEKHDGELKPIEGIEDANIYEQVDGYTTYKLFIGDFMETGNGIQKIINKLQQADPQDILEIHIASNGGSVDELLQLYNLCNTLFYDRVATFANHAYSAGAWTFLFGTDRVLYEHSSLMWHSYSGGFGGKRQDLLDHMAHEDKRLEKFLMGSLEPYFTKKELKKMNKGKDFWLDTLEACKRGICTDVIMNGEFLSADEYVESIEPGWIKMKEKEEAYKELERKKKESYDKEKAKAKEKAKKEKLKKKKQAAKRKAKKELSELDELFNKSYDSKPKKASRTTRKKK